MNILSLLIPRNPHGKTLSHLYGWTLCLLLGFLTVVWSAPSGFGPMMVRTTGNDGMQSSMDTVNVLAILVEFVEDDIPTTTGTGKFGTGFPDTMFVDPLPHDYLYFLDHLTFVKNYYEEVSNHQIVFNLMSLWPMEGEEPYQLPKFMWQYNYNYTAEVLDQQLADLFYHSWTAADSAGLFDSVDVSLFNAFVIFHAGVGKDFALGFDPTPFDIPSAYLDLDHLRDHLEISSQGIEVASGFIRGGLILPESEVQEGFELGLNGVMVKLFGNLLGIPDLYDTRNGISGIGRWGMMDQGSGNFQALIPARPCPWTLYDMGWIDPVVIYPGAPDTLEIASVTVSDTTIPKYYKIPINDQEYFLIENRQFNVEGGDYTRAWDRDGREMRLYEDYSVEVEPGFRVAVRVDDYDFDIPGSGILIWHIDEAIIDAHRDENAVNASRPWRGVDVEEADGAEDIGQEYGLFNAGYGQEYGSPWDCFYEDNEVHLESNHSTQVRFTDHTAPWSRANSGALSHLMLSQFSAIDTVMTFVLSHGFHQDGFPVSFHHGIEANSELLVDLTGDGIAEIVAVDDAGRVLAIRGDGTGLGLAGDGVLAQLTPPAGSGVFWTAASDLNGDGYPEIIISHPDSTWIFTEIDSNHLDLLDRWDVGGTTLIGGTEGDRFVAIGAGSDVIIGDADGVLRWRISYPDVGSILGMALCFNLDSTTIAVVFDQGTVKGIEYHSDPPEFGTELWSHDLPVVLGNTAMPVAGDLNGDSGGEIIVVSEHGFYIVDSGGFTGPFPGAFPVTLTSPPTLADLDMDGTMEIVIAGRGSVYAFHYNGTLASEFPVKDPGWLWNDNLLSSVLIANLAGESSSELCLTNSLGDLVAFEVGGDRVDGFPLSAGSDQARTAVLGQIDDDLTLELLIGSPSGMMYCWNLEGSSGGENSAFSWLMWGYNSGRTNLAPASPFLLEHYETPMSTNWTYCWPNPSESDRTFIRVNSGYDADIEVRIFDMAGELVDELSDRVSLYVPIDIPWTLNHVESGVYFARVEAQGHRRSDVKIVKIAVIK